MAAGFKPEGLGQIPYLGDMPKGGGGRSTTNIRRRLAHFLMVLIINYLLC
jgi:hypothetical protein